jgi:membrane protease YdiL (CAAX protease family)
MKYERYVYGIGGSLSALLLLWLFLRFERRSFKEMGLRWENKTFIRFLKGIAIGVLLFAMIVFILIAFTDLHFVSSSSAVQPEMFIWYLAIIPLAWMEELAFRSYTFLKLQNAYGLWAAQIIIAILFALYHVIGGQELYISLLGPGAWAFIFGLVAICSKGIAMPTGIHVAINILQPLFGLGGKNYKPVWEVSVSSDNVETIGIITQIILLAIGIIGTFYFLRKRELGRY